LKWLELLKEIAPHVTRAGILYDVEQPTSPAYLKTIEATAPSFKVQILPREVRDAEAIEGAIATFVADTNGGLIVLPGALMTRTLCGNLKILPTVCHHFASWQR
jgi:putative ABC transport system substrate-binding protein